MVLDLFIDWLLYFIAIYVSGFCGGDGVGGVRVLAVPLHARQSPCLPLSSVPAPQLASLENDLPAFFFPSRGSGSPASSITTHGSWSLSVNTVTKPAESILRREARTVSKGSRS